MYKNSNLGQNCDVAYKTKNEIIYTTFSFKPLLNNIFDKLLEEESNFLIKGSGWSLKSIDGFQLRTNKVNLLRGSTNIKLPSAVQNKHVIINVKNVDKKCFKYAILSEYNKQENKCRFNIKHFNFLEKTNGLNCNCITFIISLNQIKKIERINNV